MRFVRVAVLAFLLLGITSIAHAWGKTGHALIAETAARLLAERNGAQFLRTHAFDLAYYANVPDLVWKNPETYAVESYQHFMDMEIFRGAISEGDFATALGMERLKFDTKYPGVPLSAGRALWRIRELEAELNEVTLALRAKPSVQKERHRLQARWLVLAGVIAHYVGDLSQPLHTTENYDGQLSGQKGAHFVFEVDLVDELTPEISDDVLKVARALASPRHHRDAPETTDSIMSLANASHRRVHEVLTADKLYRDRGVAKHAAMTRLLITEQLAQGAATLARLWSRHLGWTYDGERFYDFDARPTFIKPPGNKPREN